MSCQIRTRDNLILQFKDWEVEFNSLNSQDYVVGIREFTDIYSDMYVDTVNKTIVWITQSINKDSTVSYAMDKNSYTLDAYIYMISQMGSNYYIPICLLVHENVVRSSYVRIDEDVDTGRQEKVDYLNLVVIESDAIGSVAITLQKEIKGFNLVEVIKWANQLNKEISMKRIASPNSIR
jgi:hypothetical protein